MASPLTKLRPGKSGDLKFNVHMFFIPSELNSLFDIFNLSSSRNN